ncbi:MAG: hypothetical protein A2Z78_01845 [Candidatus Nealsonbacteria bacterium RBG_13_36_15]|uniref:Uncharacterized protein n=1 Tax=Candidatus Nealsonbacteria bacterium RBG_13_36_15 TaxID=1801660 RepID=A0A1G2DYD7_9BACT|nr:MAG: hypothetical protein A2Z78_01845 [Candidatus Nealsonbacteria bacterium RBG_13_36_15]
MLSTECSSGSGIAIIHSFNTEDIRKAITDEVRRLTKDRGEWSWIGWPHIGREINLKIVRTNLFGEEPYWLVLAGGFNTEYFTPPLESRSKERGSQAVYFAAHEKEGLLVQGIPAGCKTSIHDHVPSGWIEEVFLLKGAAELLTCENGCQVTTFQLTSASPIGPTVKPNIIHQTRTTIQPALIVIKIRGDDQWFERWISKKGHRYRQFPKS